jgi:hypothetical protein
VHGDSASFDVSPLPENVALGYVTVHSPPPPNYRLMWVKNFLSFALEGEKISKVIRKERYEIISPTEKK